MPLVGKAWFNIDGLDSQWAIDWRESSPAGYALVSKYLPVLVTKGIMLAIPFALEPIGSFLIKFESRTALDEWVFMWNTGFKIAYLWLPTRLTT